MDKLIYFIISFLIGVLIYYLIKAYCSCKVVEGQEYAPRRLPPAAPAAPAARAAAAATAAATTAASVSQATATTASSTGTHGSNYNTDEFGNYYYNVYLNDSDYMKIILSNNTITYNTSEDINNLLYKISNIIITMTQNLDKSIFKYTPDPENINNHLKNIIFIVHQDPLLREKSEMSEDERNQYEYLSDIVYNISNSESIRPYGDYYNQRSLDGRLLDSSIPGIGAGSRNKVCSNPGYCNRIIEDQPKYYTVIADYNIICKSHDFYHTENIMIHEFSHHIKTLLSLNNKFNSDNIRKYHDIYKNYLRNNNIDCISNKIYSCNLDEFFAEVMETWFNGSVREPDPNGDPNLGIHNIDEIRQNFIENTNTCTEPDMCSRANSNMCNNGIIKNRCPCLCEEYEPFFDYLTRTYGEHNENDNQNLSILSCDQLNTSRNDILRHCGSSENCREFEDWLKNISHNH